MGTGAAVILSTEKVARILLPLLPKSITPALLENKFNVEVDCPNEELPRAVPLGSSRLKKNMLAALPAT